MRRAGFDDIASRVDLAGAVFHLNPSVRADAEIGRLRAGGTVVHLLTPAADPQDSEQLEHALRSAQHEGETVWIERATPAVPRARVEDPARALRQRLAKNAGMLASAALRPLRNEGGGRQLMLVPYFGCGNADKLWVQGRVLDEHSFSEQSGQDRGWSNLVALYRRRASDEVAGARVRAHCQGQSVDTLTDGGGYFSFEMAPAQALQGGWQTVALELPTAAEPAARRYGRARK